jgi:hypothetical protein
MGNRIRGLRDFRAGEDVIQPQLERILPCGLSRRTPPRGKRRNCPGFGARLGARLGLFRGMILMNRLLTNRILANRLPERISRRGILSLQKSGALLHGRRQAGIAHGSVGRGQSFPAPFLIGYVFNPHAAVLLGGGRFGRGEVALSLG